LALAVGGATGNLGETSVGPFGRRGGESGMVAREVAIRGAGQKATGGTRGDVVP